MKLPIILSLLLFIVPAWFLDFTKDKRVVFASLSYYGTDFDGDKRGDLSVWDPKTNTLYFQLTSDNKFYSKRFFDNSLRHEPVFADYDGDGKTDFVFFQPDSGEWTLNLTTNLGSPGKIFIGSIGDLPIPTDFDGDGKYDISLWRPIASSWLIGLVDEQGNKKLSTIQEGAYQDSAFASDYDGDGKSDLGVWRPDDGYWHIVKSSTNFNFQESEHIQHGQEWDVIVPNDYNLDGKADLVFWRPQNQTWYFVYAGDKNQNQIKFGAKNDIPISLDLDGNKIPELITWNASKKSWNVLNFTKQESFSYKWTVPDNCYPASSVLQKYE